MSESIGRLGLKYVNKNCKCGKTLISKYQTPKIIRIGYSILVEKRNVTSFNGTIQSMLTYLSHASLKTLMLKKWRKLVGKNQMHNVIMRKIWLRSNSN